MRLAASKILAKQELQGRVTTLRASGARIVLTNGVFDLVHAGHVRYLEEARLLGDVLIVGLNSDEQVAQLKGPSRPYLRLQDRLEVIASLECVDLVTSFDEKTAESLIQLIRPDVYVKGGDYRVNAREGEIGFLPEAGSVASYGGRVEIVAMVEGQSTTELVRAIKASVE